MSPMQKFTKNYVFPVLVMTVITTAIMGYLYLAKHLESLELKSTDWHFQLRVCDATGTAVLPSNAK